MERLIELLHDPIARRVSIDISAAPFEADFGRDDRLRAQMPTLEGFADDLFRLAETIYRRRIDQVDALVERFLDGGDGFAIVAPAPHPTAHRPRSEGNTRYLQRGSRNTREL